MAATLTPQSVPAVVNVKDQFLNVVQMEHQITMRLLRAYPRDKVELKPTDVMRSARELAWMFAGENALCAAVLTNSMSFPPAGAPAPDSYDAILEAIEATHGQVVELVRSAPDHTLFETTRFYVGPQTIGEVPKLQILWMMLSDSIHHRGQFSVYTRLAGGVVPSIYGPTLEVAWF